MTLSLLLLGFYIHGQLHPLTSFKIYKCRMSCHYLKGRGSAVSRLLISFSEQDVKCSLPQEGNSPVSSESRVDVVTALGFMKLWVFDTETAGINSSFEYLYGRSFSVGLGDGADWCYSPFS